MARDLSRLLRPRSIALIGGGWAENAVRASDHMGFDGEIWPVNPRRAAVGGRPAYASLSDLPAPPDAAFVAVNRDAAIEVVGALAKMGAGGAVCFASGFAETDDASRQAALVEAAGDMPLLGPNCYGLINYLDGALLWPDQQGQVRVKKGVAIVSQSSNIAINMSMQARGLPIAYLVCAGNQAQTGLAELGQALAADVRVTALGFYVEGVGDPAAFAEMAAAARDAGKPVIAIKSGWSDAAQAATISHTASLAGAAAASAAYFQRIGVPVLRSLPAFLETLKLLHIGGPIAGRGLCAVSCSGGEASLTADAAEGRDLTFPAFSAEAGARVRATLNDYVAIANPIDYHTFIWGDEAKMTACFAAILSGGFDLTLFIVDFPREDRCSAKDWAPAVAAIKAAAAETGARAAVVASMAENMPETVAEDFAAAGIAPLIDIDHALAAAEAAAACAEASRTARATIPPMAARAVAPPPARTLDEGEGKALLKKASFAIPAGARANDAAEAALRARDLGGQLAVKRLGLAHKTEAGGLTLNIAPEEVEAAAKSLGPGPYLVERMVENGVGELILGVTQDPAYGPVLTIGAGGVAAELLRDTVTLIPPVNVEEAEAALRQLRLFPLIDGYRGRPKGDVKAAARAIARLSDFALAHGAMLEELDINPLIVTPSGAYVADALIRLREPEETS